ncbi:response regulator transcription factor [Thermodesulfobacteriota bacterium]
MKNTEKKRILIIEDEAHIAEGLEFNLSILGYDTEIALDGVSGLQKWKTFQPDLIVLDIMLPGIDGISVLQNIRLEDEQIPILILSAKSTPEDKVEALSCGVDDYLSKPFNLEEFLLRIERLLKRASWLRGKGDIDEAIFPSLGKTYTFGDNHVDFETSVARCKKGEVRLTEQEVKLLKLFIVNRRKPLSRSKLLEIGWGYTRGMSTRTVDNFIVRFRKYFEENPKKPVYFKSLRSVGYVFDHE